jgi:hypothetical protein
LSNQIKNIRALNFANHLWWEECVLISDAGAQNTVPGDKSAMNPSGIRLGTPSLTTRGLLEKDMEQVVAFIHSALQLGIQVCRFLPARYCIQSFPLEIQYRYLPGIPVVISSSL